MNEMMGSGLDEMPWEAEARVEVERALAGAIWHAVARVVVLPLQGSTEPVVVCGSENELLMELMGIAHDAWMLLVPVDEGEVIFQPEVEEMVWTALEAFDVRLREIGWRRVECDA